MTTYIGSHRNVVAASVTVREGGDSGITGDITRLVLGGVSGSLAKTTIAPFERVKIIFQVSQKVFTFQRFRHEFMNIARNDGIPALWRGNTANIARVFPYAGIQFLCFDRFKVMIVGDGNAITPMARFLAGAFSGIVAVLCTYPLDLIRARMAVQSTQTHKFTGLNLTIKEVLNENGWKGLYRGVIPTLMGIFPYGGLSFFTYHTLNAKVRESRIKKNQIEDPGVTSRLLCGGVAGLVAQTVTYPLDVLRRRMQMGKALLSEPSLDAAMGARGRSHSLLELFLGIIKQEGIRKGLFKGVTINWIKGPVAVGISFASYDFLKTVFQMETRS